MPLGSGGLSTAFAVGLSPAPIGPFPHPALRTGRAVFPHPALQWEHASRTQNAGSGSHSRTGGLCTPSVQRLHGLTRKVTLAVAPPGLFTPRRYRASIRPGPFAYACDASELSATSRGVRRQHHSRGLSLLRHPSTPEAPFLNGQYPASPTAYRPWST